MVSKNVAAKTAVVTALTSALALTFIVRAHASASQQDRPVPVPTVGLAAHGSSAGSLPRRASLRPYRIPVRKQPAPQVTPVRSMQGVAASRYLLSDPAKLAALNVSWAYNWSSNGPVVPSTLAFVPMVWGAGSVTDSTIAALRRGARAGRFSQLLGFNEPDRADQANMSPERAIALWPKLEATGLRLGSPAPADPWNGWLRRFMALAAQHNRRVDFIALHFYQDFTNPNAVYDLKGQLGALYQQYHKPIWITELGAIAWGGNLEAPTVALADSYMSRAVTTLDGLRYVERYAWFADNCSSDPVCRFTTLYDARGTLTSHGRTYAALGVRARLRPKRQ